MTLLNAVLKAASDSYPSDGAMIEMGSLEFSSLSPASAMRQCARYSIGDVPTVSLNFRAKVDRDMPARAASSCNVHRYAVSSCMAFIAVLICLSASAKSQPTPALDPSARCSRSACTNII